MNIITNFELCFLFIYSQRSLKIKYKNEEKYSFLYKNYELEYKNIMEKYQDLDKKNLDIIKQF